MAKYSPACRNGLNIAVTLLRGRSSINGSGYCCQSSPARPLFSGTGRAKSFATTSPLNSKPNPGNFANRPREEVKEIARKGGQKGGKIGGRARGVGGFHDMDPAKQREIASKGGHASSGSFQKGSERAREAGRKWGRRRSEDPYEEEPFI